MTSTTTRPGVSVETSQRTTLAGRIFSALARAPRLVRLAFASLAAFLLVSGGAVASAAPADPTGGVFETAQDSLTGTIIPAAAGLVVIGIVFSVAVKWMSKAMRKG